MHEDETIRTAAIEAAAKVNLESNGISKWDKASDRVKNAFRNGQAKTVDAVLAVAGPAYRAEALRDTADKWQQGQWADAPRRADRVQERIANAQHVTDWLRECANAEEADHA